GLRVHVVAVAVQLLLAEIAAAAEDVEGHQHPVAGFQVADRRAHFFHHAAEFVADDRTHAGVGHQAVVDVDVGAADAAPGDPHDRVVGMLDHGLGDVRDAHAARAPVCGGQHGRLRGRDPDLGGAAVNATRGASQ